MEASSDGENLSEAERFGVAAATVIRLARAFRATGRLSAEPTGGDLRSHCIEAFRQVVLGAIEAQKDTALAELVALLRREHGASFAISTVHRQVVRHRITLKKAVHAAEQDRPDVACRRQSWFDTQPDLDPRRLVFIDETGATTTMARLRGRAPRGQRCRAAVPRGHWKTTTLVGALRLDGMTAPMVLDCPMNGAAFLAYAEQVLVPTLKRGNTVVMDKLPTRLSACRPPSWPRVNACAHPRLPAQQPTIIPRWIIVGQAPSSLSDCGIMEQSPPDGDASPCCKDGLTFISGPLPEPDAALPRNAPNGQPRGVLREP